MHEAADEMLVADRVRHLGLGSGTRRTATRRRLRRGSLPPPASVDGSSRTVAKYARVCRSLRNAGDCTSASLNCAGQLLNVLWEDTGRWEGSAVGPNISDVTIEVR